MAHSFKKGDNYLVFAYAKEDSTASASWWTLADQTSGAFNATSETQVAKTKDYKETIVTDTTWQMTCSCNDATDQNGITYLELLELQQNATRVLFAYASDTTAALITSGHTMGSAIKYGYGVITSLQRKDDVSTVSSFDVTIDMCSELFDEQPSDAVAIDLNR